MKMSYKLFCLVAFLSLATFSGCSHATKNDLSKSISATDSRGKVIKLKDVAKRVVVLFPSLLDEVYMLQAGDQVVGIPQQVYQMEDTYAFLSKLDSRIAAKTLPTPTYGGQSSNVESIIALQPDLVITFNTDQDNIQQLEGLDIPVFTCSSADDKSIMAELLGMGTLVGKQERAQEIVDYVDGELDRMQVPSIENAKSVYYAWSKGRVMSTSGKGSLIDMAIRLSGAENACPLPMEAPNISAETMYKWNPDLIILWNSKLSDVYDLKELADLPAVKNKQVFVMSPSFPFDPHTVKFLLFAKQVRHWSFPSYSEEQLKKEMQGAFEVMYGKKGLL